MPVVESAPPEQGAPSLKQRLAGGEQLVGALVRMPNEDVVEMLAVAGMGFVLLDCEHGPADVLALRHHLALADAHGVPALVRVGHDEPALVLRALDQGAQGIVAPHVDTVEQARALVASAHYPPLGGRGFATYPRAGRFGETAGAQHRERAAATTLVIAMVESPAAVAATAGILAVEGVDGYMIGPADLAASRGADDAPLEDLLASVHRAAAGSVRTEIVGSAEQAGAALDQGAALVVHNLTQEQMALFRDLARPRRSKPS